MSIFYCSIIGYLFGCILTAEIVGRCYGKDIREIDPECPHRGNPGTANVLLNMGYKPGIIVFVGDILKVVISMGINYHLFFKELGNDVFLYSGFASLVGHNYPFWRKFNGGKGVTVTAIWLLFIMPKYSWITYLAGVAIALITGYLNLGAAFFPIVAIPLAFIFYGTKMGIFIIISEIIMILRNLKDIKAIFNNEYKAGDFLNKL